MAQVANSAPVTVGVITAQWPLIQWTIAPSGTPPNTTIQTAVSTGARGSAIFTSSNSPKYRHSGVVRFIRRQDNFRFDAFTHTHKQWSHVKAISENGDRIQEI